MGNTNTRIVHADTLSTPTSDFSVNIRNLGAGGVAKNYLANGGMEIAQRLGGGVSTSLTTSFAYNTVDRWAIKETGTGTATLVSQAVGSANAPTNRLSDASLSLSLQASTKTNLTFRQRIESALARELTSASVSLSFWINITNGPTQATVTFRSANTQDDFSSTTIVGSATNISTPANSTWTQYTIDNFSLNSAVYNGLELEIDLNNMNGFTGNIKVTQLILTKTVTAQNFIKHGLDMSQELSYCQRFYEKSYTQADNIGGTVTRGAEFAVASNSTNPEILTARFKVVKRAIPAVTLYNPSTGAASSIRNFTAVSNVAAAANNIADSGFSLGSFTPVDTNLYGFHWVADSEL